ncbi:hypothetical protein QOZ80_5BG0445940 [Eleusine coracana subsp. coracana]|nr:hypothetical protein QOZ80_5BG0445940 [Eleusine coracana subsp. coracana]
MEEEFEKGMGPKPKRFSYGELAIATNNFSDEHNKLSGTGSIYRGFLKETGLAVAIKRVSKTYCRQQGWNWKELGAEVRIISRLRHCNLVQLIGWCHHVGGDDELLLVVYELMRNGCLDTYLHSDDTLLLMPWSLRHSIVLELGLALLYLHEQEESLCVVHGNIMPSNVMLDDNFHAKLGDLGLAGLVDHTAALNMLYVDPERMVRGRPTNKANAESDVYSFGVVLLEIASGRQPMVTVGKHVIHLVEWVWEAYGRGTTVSDDESLKAWLYSFVSRRSSSRGSVLDAADGRLDGEFNVREMETVLIVGLWCAHPKRSMRPSIRQAVQVLRSEAQLPTLPPRMPVAT